MFALFFLYALIIAVVIGAVVLVLKVANLIDRKKKMARQHR